MTEYPKYLPERMTKWELLEIIRMIDNSVPRADATCDESGITLSEAVFRKIYDMRKSLKESDESR